MNQNGYRFLTVVLVATALTIGNATIGAAQQIHPGDDVAQEQSDPTRGGYIKEFLAKRSGEPGVFGFIAWMLSKDLWRDFGRFIETKIGQRLEDLMNGLGDADSTFHAFDVFSQPLVFVCYAFEL